MSMANPPGLVTQQQTTSSMAQPQPIMAQPAPMMGQPAPMMGQPIMMAGPPPPQMSTTVVSTGGMVGGPLVLTDFQTGICDCFSDLNVCFMSWCCPCIVYGQIERLLQTNGADSSTDTGHALLCCCASYLGNALLAFVGLPGVVHAFFICGQRRRFRNRANIIGGDCEDGAWSCCCPHCALGQVYLEETRYKVLSRNPLGVAPVGQFVVGGPQMTVVTTNNGAPQPMYAPPGQPIYAQQPMYAAAPGQPVQPVYAAAPGQPAYGQPVYAQPPGVYAAPPPGAAGSPPQYYQPVQPAQPS